MFGEGSYKFTDSWKLTTGVRWYDFKTDVDEWQNGIGTATGNASSTVAAFSTTAHGFNPKVNLSYEPTHDLNVYASASKGFRPGGVNLPIPSNLGCTLTQETYKPDSIWDYELGEKANFLDRRLSVNGDIFYIDWTDVQQEVNQGSGYPLTANAGKARSYGTELEVSTLLTSELTLSVSGTYTNAKLTQVNPALSAADSALVPGITDSQHSEVHGKYLPDLCPANQHRIRLHRKSEQLLRRSFHGYFIWLHQPAIPRYCQSAVRVGRAPVGGIFIRK